MLRSVLLSLAFAPLAGCHITIDSDDGEVVWFGDDFHRPSTWGGPSREIASVVTGEDRESRFTLSYGKDGVPELRRVDTIERPVAHLGVEAGPMDRERSASLDLPPWKGIFVKGVAEGSPAERAGLRKGDVLLAIDDRELAAPEQFVEFVQDELEPDQDVGLRVSRVSVAGGRSVVELGARCGSRPSTQRTKETLELTSSPDVEATTGIQLAEIPAAWSREMFGADAPQVWVSGVRVGSTGYLAGIRAGDRVDRWNGVPISHLGQLAEASVSGAEEALVEVTGPRDTHDSAVEFGNVDRRSSFHIPIVYSYSDRPARKRISFLDFIFQFGFNYEREYLPTSDREPARFTDLSILPLGMFEFERSPTESRNTLFWLIRWKTSNG